ncbi:MAG: ATP synthase subunit C [Betaproteobacteria bacterium]|jgi:V/A-type H+-transporting ATPase subunit K|nr:ATP synthase subunit C [Betaproteobacteria bacterium]
MYWLIALLVLSLSVTLGAGILFTLRPRSRWTRERAARWFKRGVVAHLSVIGMAVLVIFIAGTQDVSARTIGHTPISLGLGLALLGIGIPTGLGAIGAGIAMGPVGAASLAVISEKPELFGRTLIYLGLAEGIAIYGLVVTILLLGKI